LVETSASLVKFARRLGVPITVSEHYPKGLGPTVDGLRRELGAGAAILPKQHFSWLGDEPLCQRLEDIRDTGRGQAVLAGIEAHVCVAQTALDLIVEGFEVFIVADAVASRTEDSRALSLQRLRHAGAYIVDSEMVMFEWLEVASTPEFKDLLPLIKGLANPAAG
jgi:hypothetical protein